MTSELHETLSQSLADGPETLSLKQLAMYPQVQLGRPVAPDSVTPGTWFPWSQVALFLISKCAARKDVRDCRPQGRDFTRHVSGTWHSTAHSRCSVNTGGWLCEWGGGRRATRGPSRRPVSAPTPPPQRSPPPATADPCCVRQPVALGTRKLGFGAPSPPEELCHLKEARQPHCVTQLPIRKRGRGGSGHASSPAAPSGLEARSATALSPSDPHGNQHALPSGPRQAN